MSRPSAVNVTVAITGTSGYIGSALVGSLESRGCKTLLVSSKHVIPSANGRSLRADVRELECWMEIVKFADVIFHLAGNTSVYAAASDPTESLNSTLLPITQLLKACSVLRRKPRVILASTATVYGLTTALPVAESVVPSPITVYDIHKLFAELQLDLATKQGMIEGINLRLSNVYGPSISKSSSPDRGILNRVAAKGINGEDIVIFGDGSHLRDYVYIDDVVEAFLLVGLAIGSPTGVFNVGGGSAVTINEAFRLVGCQVEQICGRKVSIIYKPWPASSDPIEFRNYTAECKKINNIFGWSPAISMVDGITALIKSMS